MDKLMKKHLIVIGIVALLLVVGLSGCTDVGIGLTNIGDITANPDNYYGKEVTVEGTCSFIMNYGLIIDDAGHRIYFTYHNSINGNYQLTGIIRNDDIGLGGEILYLDVTQVKAL